VRHPLSTSGGLHAGVVAVRCVDGLVVVDVKVQAVPEDFEPAVAELAQCGVVMVAGGDLCVVGLAGRAERDRLQKAGCWTASPRWRLQARRRARVNSLRPDLWVADNLCHQARIHESRPRHDGARSHDQAHPGQQRQPRPVRPRQPRMHLRPQPLRGSEMMAQHQDLGVLPPRLPARQPSSAMTRDTTRKISFKPTSRRSFHLRTDRDLPAQRPNAGWSRPLSAEHLPR
jgi:hypothetical protein